MAKTSKEARKHISELSKLFSESLVISEEVLRDFIDNYKQRKYLKQSLNRLIVNGFIEKTGNKFSLSKIGSRFFRKNFQNLQAVKKWDGKWYLIGFDIPIALNLKRDKLRRILKSYNFYPLQKSVWVGPNKFGKDIWEFIVENKLPNYCKVMIVDVIEGDEILRKHFKI